MYEKNLSRNDQSDIYEKPIRKWSIAQLVQDERTLFLTNFSVHCPILMKFSMHSYVMHPDVFKYQSERLCNK